MENEAEKINDMNIVIVGDTPKTQERDPRVSFKAIMKRKILSVFTPFAIALFAAVALHCVLFWTTQTETPFAYTPFITLVLFVLTKTNFAYDIERNYGITRSKSYVTSYLTAAIYSAIMSVFLLALSVLFHYFKGRNNPDATYIINFGDIICALIYGFFACMLTFSSSSILFRRRHKGKIWFIVLFAVLEFGLPLLLSWLVVLDGRLWQVYNAFGDDNGLAALLMFLMFVSSAAIDKCLLNSNII